MMLLENGDDVDDDVDDDDGDDVDDDDDDGKCSKYGWDELCQRLFLIFDILGKKNDIIILGQKKIYIIILGQKHLQRTGAVAPDQQVRENICLPISVKCILYIYSV